MLNGVYPPSVQAGVAPPASNGSAAIGKDGNHPVRRSAWVFVIAAAFVCSALAQEAKGPEVPWAKSWDEALAQAKADGKPIMIDFYTDWCGWCKKLDADTYPDPSVVQYLADFVCVKLNAEKEGKDQAKTYNVSAYPTIVFADSSGAYLGRVLGYRLPAPFIAEVKKVMETAKEMPALLEQAKTNPKDGDTLLKLHGIYIARGEAKAAAALVPQIERSKLPTKDALGVVYFDTAEALQNARQPDPAMEYYKQALKRLKDPEKLGECRWGMAMVYYSKKDYKKALGELSTIKKMKGVSENLTKQVDGAYKFIEQQMNKPKEETKPAK
jgi:thiol-disulfide isomerase/thioredoxin